MPVFQRAIKTIQGADDGPGTLGAGEDTETLVWDNGTSKFVMAAGGGGGTSDHAALTNLDYASAGHTGFAGTGVVNVFTRQQTLQANIADVTLGGELLTDSAFPDLTNWNDDASGWNIVSGGITHTPGAAGELYQSISLTVANVFVIEISVIGMTAGYVEAYDDSSNLDAYTEANGVIRGIGGLSSDYASNTIYLDVSADFDGKIEYISLKQSAGGWPALASFNQLDSSSVAEVRANGSSSFFIGSGAGARNDKFSSGNIGIGSSALGNNVLGSGNLAFGASALQGDPLGLDSSDNVGIGNSALATLRDGHANAAFGTFSLGNLVHGSDNLGLGPGSGISTDASRCIYIGKNSGSGNITDDKLFIANNETLPIIEGTMSDSAATQSLKFHAAIINMADLPTSSAGLSTGDLYTTAGALFVA